MFSTWMLDAKDVIFMLSGQLYNSEHLFSGGTAQLKC